MISITNKKKKSLFISYLILSYLILKMDTNLEEMYWNSLSEKERKAYEVAKNHLGSLWDVYKCNGFLQWKKKQDTRKES